MQKTQGHTFFIDIDGTILFSGRSEVTEGVRAAISTVRANGSKVFINTARPRVLVSKELTDGLFDGICCGGGTYIEYGGKCIYERYISEDILSFIVKSVILNDNETTICFEGSEKMYYYGKKLPKFGDNYYPVSSPNDFKTVYKGAKIQKFCTPSGVLPSKSLTEALSKHFDVYLYPHYAEWMTHGYDKGQAIRIAERTLGIDHSTTVAIGDSLNDLPMLEYASVGVAMGNAPDEVKTKCDIVTDTAENDGVAKALIKITEKADS